VTIIGEHIHPEVASRCRTLAYRPRTMLDLDHDLLIYHHSFDWREGEQIVRRFPGRVVAKYHNVTPPEFFAPYHEGFRASCEQGRLQTARLAGLEKIVRWQGDSGFNCGELRELGVPETRLGIVPPFNRLDRLFAERRTAVYAFEGPFTALFVGRRAPNKGHAHLLRTLGAWRDLYPEAELRLRMVGSYDRSWALYQWELDEIERELGIAGQLEYLDHISNAELEEIFRASHIYLNLSEHEGFCVPLIEAQALGMPIVTTGAAALAETAGPGQIVVPVPRVQADYDMIAGLMHELCVSASTRNHVVVSGFRNAFQRFASQAIEASFLGDLAPVLESLET
jgi:glycosyltransferase involved in cell wall biosynthesis